MTVVTGSSTAQSAVTGGEKSLEMKACCNSRGPLEMPDNRHNRHDRPCPGQDLGVLPVLMSSILTNEFVGSKRRNLTFDRSGVPDRRDKPVLPAGVLSSGRLSYIIGERTGRGQQGWLRPLFFLEE